ncbi:MAG: ATPase [Alphaproteobacteria bacterium]
MALGTELMDAGLIERDQLDTALEEQDLSGLPLGECLLAVGAISTDQLDRFFSYSVPPLASLRDTGLETAFMLDLLVKIMFVYGHESKASICEEIKLPFPVVEELMELARERRLIEALGSSGDATLIADIRYGLSDIGRETAQRALQRSQYAGPAPVTLEAYRDQILRQRIVNDRVDHGRLQRALSHLVLDDALLKQLGPSVNSGRALLLYGAPGNGKTTLAVGITRSFEQYVYVPHAVYVSGHIINVYDRTIHTVVGGGRVSDSYEGGQRLRRSDEDPRWVRCQRPVAITGGELTLDMLDVSHDANLRFSEAPMQMKALGGVFLIDDLGRQAVRVEEILNRWIFPLERRVDYLTLPSGKTFTVPFDGLIIFSTNKPPSKLMDDAMLRRIPYKFRIGSPNIEEYGQIFIKVCEDNGVEFKPLVLERLLQEFYAANNMVLASFHPAFMMRHVVATCRFQGRRPEMDIDLMLEAADHLMVHE